MFEDVEFRRQLADLLPAEGARIRAAGSAAFERAPERDRRAAHADLPVPMVEPPAAGLATEPPPAAAHVACECQEAFGADARIGGHRGAHRGQQVSS